ncbi:hypothetical protein BDP27DRAFT_442401 [Rhodocollybia butyracea]|uniref:Uncharacterized protein n=1 Tax=Rhodocollybia butyracea TaxID=206335 RepID=A0A9P5TZ40_9AGAR|nr:hypothetical protein BDP27DRAFT_442401 [Rhodocollybia butyracea]
MDHSSFSLKLPSMLLKASEMNSLDLPIFLAIPIGLAIVLIIQTPLNGVLIRYRANFVPPLGGSALRKNSRMPTMHQ